MEPEDAFVATFGAALIDQDWKRAHGMLAPWLGARISAGGLRDQVAAVVDEMCAEWEIDAEGMHPRAVETSGNPLDLAGLRACTPELPAEITEANLRGWRVATLLPGEDEEVEFDAYADLWMAVVATPDGLAVGFFEFMEPD